MFTAKKWLVLYVLVFLGYNSIYNYNAGALTLDYSKDRFGVMEGVQTDTIFAVSDTTPTDTSSQIRYNAGEDVWQLTNDGGSTYGTIATSLSKLSFFTATTSAELAGVISDETGSGGLVFADSPTLATPTIGAATATSIQIGANTLDTNEWANLDGLDQAVKTTSTPTFAGANIGDVINTELQYLDGVTSAIQTQLNGKEPTVTKGNLISGTSVLTVTGGSSAVIGSGTSLILSQATSTDSGFLNSTDWNTFNNKQNTITNPVTGTGTAGYGTRWLTGSSVTSATNTDTEVADAVTKKHSQNTDTGTSGNFDIVGRLSVGNPTTPTKTVEIKLTDTSGADSVVVRNSSGTIINTIGSNGLTKYYSSWLTTYGSLALTDTDNSSGSGITFWTNNFGTRTGYVGYDKTYNRLVLWNTQATPIDLATNDTPVMRITGDGKVGIGTTAPLAKLQVNKSWTDSYGSMALTDTDNSSGAGITFWQNNMVTRTGYIGYSTDYLICNLQDTNMRFFTGSSGSTERMRITAAGNVGIGTTSPGYLLTMESSGGGFYNAANHTWTDGTSSIYLKENIKPIQKPLEKVMKLRGVSFDWKKGKKGDIGFIAEELGEVVPEVVVRSKENPQQIDGVATSKLTALLVEAIKEQQSQIKELQKEIEGLEQQLLLLNGK